MTEDIALKEIEGEPAVAYVRVSPGRVQAAKADEPDGYSLPAQLSACERKAQSLGAVVIEKFMERSESAKTADRPELQRLLQFVKENRVKYVIVHKVDRLARNRTDDVLINLALKQAGTQLVSVSENIDETPSGLLMHGIMSSIAEFYSRNLATEVNKGLVQKAKTGGTPGRAPTGYVNVRQVINGLEGRTVEVDPVRGPLMAWAFETYATGEWTLRALLDELTRRGLTTAPSAKRPGKALTISRLHSLLRHPYYIGIVRYRGVLYPGKHPPLVSSAVWHEVQKILHAKNYAGEKQREHPHYLKGTIYCGQCNSRLIVCHAKGRGGTYPYFVCIGRQQKRTTCTQRAIRIEQAEAAVAAYYGSVQLPAAEVARLRDYLGQELAKLRADAGREQSVQERRVRQIEGERQKLLTAHYADAIPLDLLKVEQDRLTQEITHAESRLQEIAGDFRKAEANLEAALAWSGHCELAYHAATAKLRRRFNQAFFERLWLDDDNGIRGEFAAPFDLILGKDTRQAASLDGEELTDAIDEALRKRAVDGRHEKRPRGATPALVGASATSAPLRDGGLNANKMVGETGFEPATARPPAGCATRLRHSPWCSSILRTKLPGHFPHEVKPLRAAWRVAGAGTPPEGRATDPC